MQVSRKEKGSEALMIIETDQPVEQKVLDEIAAQPGITGATLFA
jgi:L-serine dehydratase